MLLLDAGVLLAQADADDPQHENVVRLLQGERGPLVTSQIVLAEADYLILTRLGLDLEISFLHDLAAGTFIADCLTQSELALARDIVVQYRDLALGVADASLVVLAERYNTRRLATFNERDFRAVMPLRGGAFSLLPADL